MAKRKTAKQGRQRQGLLPGESKRRSLVTVARETLRPGSDEIGRESHNYIVSTRRMDQAWSHEIEYRGQTWMVPGQVVDCILRHKQSIIQEQRRVRAQETYLRLRAKAEADQTEAEAQRKVKSL